MLLISKRVIRKLLKKYQIKPSKRLGQNFLVDEKVLQKIIKTANLSPEDIILEIGPGIGTLTKELAKRAKKIIAVEKDREMVEILSETLKDYNNVKVVNDDVLKIENWKFIGYWKATLRGVCRFAPSREIGNFKVVANLPYYITSPVIRKFLEMDNSPKIMVLMVQKEIAQRICAKPPNMSILAIAVQFYAKPEVISFVSKESFWPSPKVDSAIIKIIPKERSTFSTLVENVNQKNFEKRFLKLVKAGFSQPRKQLANNLSKVLKLDKAKANSWLLKNNIKPTQRAETLSIRDWIRLVKSINIY